MIYLGSCPVQTCISIIEKNDGIVELTGSAVVGRTLYILPQNHPQISSATLKV